MDCRDSKELKETWVQRELQEQQGRKGNKVNGVIMESLE